MSSYAFRSHIFLFIVFILVIVAFMARERTYFFKLGYERYILIAATLLFALTLFDLFVGFGVTRLVVDSAYFWVGLIGLCVGAVELVARYRDNPQRALQTLPALFYMAINVVACLAILHILQIVQPAWLYPAAGSDALGTQKNALYLILTAGFGAVALFRSSIFKIKTSEGELAVGPAVILDTILSASDRAVDRIIAGPRGVAVADIMKDVSFNRAKVALPTYCFALMQNISHQEQMDIGDQVNALSVAQMDDRIRALNLGLALLNVVGVKVLASAVKDLDRFIQDDPPIERTDAANFAGLIGAIDYAKASSALPAYCFSLVSTITIEAQRSFFEQVTALSAATIAPRVKCLILVLSLSKLVGYPAVSLAIRQLGRDIE